MTRRGVRGRAACAREVTRRAGRRRMRAESRCSRVGGRAIHRARYYSPYLCRFVSSDPAGFAGGLNHYAYANGNPVSYLDPFGLGAVGENVNTSWVNPSLNIPDMYQQMGNEAAAQNADTFGNAVDFLANAYQYHEQDMANSAITIGGRQVELMPGPSGIIGDIEAITATGSEGLQLTTGAGKTLAGTQNGVLLGTIENGEINLFDASAGQIEGHSGLLNQGLVSPNAEGFSINIQNGQPILLRSGSSLNPAANGFNLSEQNLQQIQQIFRVTEKQTIRN